MIELEIVRTAWKWRRFVKEFHVGLRGDDELQRHAILAIDELLKSDEIPAGAGWIHGDSSEARTVRDIANNPFLRRELEPLRRFSTLVLNDASKEVTITSSGGQSITMDAAGAVKIKGVSQVTVDAPKINLGAAAASSLVLGEAMLTAFNAHTHNCTAPGTPSGPPVPPMLPSVLSTTNKTA